MSIYDSLITRKDRLSVRFTVTVKYRKYSLYEFYKARKDNVFSLSVIFTYYRFQSVKTFFTRV